MIPFSNDIEQCLITLSNGGIILYPTDTIWGIGCDATSATAVEKVYALKKRSTSKNMIILLAEEKDILTHVTQPELQIFDYIKGVSKPTTVIYEGATGLAENLISEDGTIAIRIVSDAFCRLLIKRFGKPLVSTSANISGYPPPAIFNDIDITIKNGVDYIVQHRQDDVLIAAPSAIVRWNKNGIPTIIRK
ncbi:MAG: translation factor [Ferruginibacter sp.]|nr:translation factor [Ferruginibacter sp.]